MAIRLLAVLVMLGAAAPAAVFNFYSSFDAGAEGWTTIGQYNTNSCVAGVCSFSPGVGGLGPYHSGTGGVMNSGHLWAEDFGGGFLMFFAPSSWSGNLYGGTLSFYLRSGTIYNYREYYNYVGDPVVVIQGSGGPDLRAIALPGATSQWTFNSVSLSESFQWMLSSGAPASPSDIYATMSTVTQIAILADWVPAYRDRPVYGCPIPGYNCEDITGLDEVRLYGGEIPEPGTMGLLAAGLAALAVWRRRAR
ncbi:MAG: hypothetical protein KatS3mg005_1294 [Bryobacteraceae bacterium]|nr:MAG: hypothetical protein KatS3mg005_1294 [Bryobacteraceae bacterium]